MRALLALALFAFAASALAQTFTGNNLGVISTDNRIFPGTVQIGGTATAGNSVTVTVTIGTAHYPFTVATVNGDTPQTIVDRFISILNADPTMQRYGITGLQGNPTVTAFSVTPQRGWSLVPTIAVSVSAGATLTATVTRQPSDSLDAAPLLYLDRDVGAVRAGDTIGPFIFGMGDAVNPACCTTAYTMLQSIVMNPDPAAIEGAFAIDNACFLPSFGNVCNRVVIGRGIQIFDAASAPPAGGDMGAGTINLPASGGFFKNGAPLVSRQSMGGYSGSAISGTAISYIGLTTQGADIFSNLIGIAVPGTARNFTASVSQPPGVGQSYVMTLVINGAPTLISCTVPAAGSSCTDTAHTLSIGAPASMTIRATPSSSATPVKVIWSLEYDTPL